MNDTYRHFKFRIKAKNVIIRSVIKEKESLSLEIRMMYLYYKHMVQSHRNTCLF